MEKDTILIHPSGNEISFTEDHAKRLMEMSNNGGWKWKFDPADESSETPDDFGNETSIQDSSNGAGNNRDQGNSEETKEPQADIDSDGS